MKRHKISHRIYLIVGVVIALLMVIQILLYKTTTDILEEQREQSLNNMVQHVNSSVKNKLSIISYYSRTMIQKGNFLEDSFDTSAFSEKWGEFFSELRLYSNYNGDPLYGALFLPNSTQKLSSNMSDNVLTAIEEQFAVYSQSGDYTAPDHYIFFTLEGDPYNHLYICCFAPFYTYQTNPVVKERLGTLAICAKLNPVRVSFGDKSFQNAEIQLIHQTNGTTLSFICYESQDNSPKLALSATELIPTTDWLISGNLYVSSEADSLTALRDYIIADVLIIIILFLWLSNTFRRSISVPLNKLVRYMSRISGYQQPAPLEISDNAEFEFLSKQLNDLLQKNNRITESLLEMQQKNYQLDMDKVSLELQSLQLQINPHFLYNTLECIRSIATVYGVPEIERVSYSLSLIMRYSTAGNPIVTLGQELESLESYLEIMEIRYRNSYQLTTQIPPEYLQCNLPKMTLQPLLENTFKHALSGQKPLEIQISATKTDDTLKIEVRDNGKGISSDKLEEITRRLEEGVATSQQHIGLYNVNRRIKIYCGNQYGLSLESQKDAYTTIILRLPFQNF